MAKHDIIKLRRGTATEWSESLPQPGGEVLKLGEPGYEKDTGKLKIGDGTTGWNNLPYIAAGVIVVEDIDHLVNDVLQSGSGIALNFDDSNDTLTISNTLSVAAVEWTPNHTLADGTRYLVNDLVYESGNIYKANFENESLPVSNTTYWTNLGAGYRLNIDGRDVPNIPYPEVNNPLNNRVLTSDGTSTGINAESNFTYNDTNSAVVLSREGAGNTSLQLIQSSEVSATQNARIDLTRNRGTLSSPLPLNSGDFIGSINFNTLNISNINSNSAQIAVSTVSGLSTYNDTPVRITIKNRMDNGQFNNFSIEPDGSVRSSNGATIGLSSSGPIYGSIRSTNLELFSVPPSVPKNHALGAGLSWTWAKIDPDNTIPDPYGGPSIVSHRASAYATVPSGVVSSSNGLLLGLSLDSLRNAFDNTDFPDNIDDGLLANCLGASISYGHNAAGEGNPQTTSAIGLQINPNAGAGTIDTAYDILLNNTQNTSFKLVDGEIVTKTGSGTITEKYGIVQLAADPNVFNGSLVVGDGLSAPIKIYDLGTVSSNTSISYAIDKQIQQLTLNGTATNFIEGSGWPSTTSVDVLLEITVSSTTSVTWSIVDDWYNPVPSFVPGKYLVLLRSIGVTIQGHYIGEKTN